MRTNLLTLSLGGVFVALYGLSKLGEQRKQQPKPERDWTKDYTITIEPAPRFDAPMYEVGNEVFIYNPYEDGYYAQYDNVSPTLYEIIDVKYDDEEGVYRYRLENGSPTDWYSEDWLSLPIHTTFIRNLNEKKSEYNRVNPTPEMIEAERKIIDKAMDDMARKATVDALLDRMNAGDAEERREAMRKLSELTTKEESE
ncbi:hypothetical protein [Virgibacillus pantothenticus]|uniref:hypothetical protein n=1 Tax=Virgibacillus pantothenticus TaxID=1473 RepID=UPI000985FDD2|nr:hypothetical protein [Virgibacillus pantothenticus]